MYGKTSANGYVEVSPGIRAKTIVYGKESLMTEFRLKKGALLPPHSHVYEQTGYLVRGRMRLFIDGRAEVMEPGDSWNIASNVTHQAEIEEDSVAVEVFVPKRGDYIAYVNDADLVE